MLGITLRGCAKMTDQIITFYPAFIGCTEQPCGHAAGQISSFLVPNGRFNDFETS